MNLRIGIPLLLLLTVILGAVALFAAEPASSMGDMPGMASAAAPAGHAMAMSDADMAAEAARYWATHAPVGVNANAPAVTASTVDTVTVNNFIFDVDGNIATQIDTVRIAPGDGIYWKWIGGTHTVTSGTGSLDPNHGLLFDAPVDLTHTSFEFAFANAGTVPYYCTFHEGFNMKGVIVVDPLVAVDRTAVGTGIGFASHPWPNPTGSSLHFRYTLREAGRVRAEVLDVRGRLVSVVTDGEKPAGTYESAWDGRVQGGRRAAAGRYFVRLVLPGYVGSQSIVLTR